MPNLLVDTDPLLAHNFFLEINGEVIAQLSSVSGLDVEVDVAEVKQTTKDGKNIMRKTLGARNKAPDLTLERIAAPDSTSDALWKWFNAIYAGGMKLHDVGAQRKDGSIVLYDSTLSEIARFNFENGWPSKISTSGLSVEGSDPVKETITLTVEHLERVK